MPADPATDLRRLLGAAVRAERLRRRLTQEELGSRLGWSQGTVSDIESGARPIGLHETPALARALGCDAGRFFEDAPAADRAAMGYPTG